MQSIKTPKRMRSFNLVKAKTIPMKRKEFVELWNDHISQLCKARVMSESMRPSESAMTIVAATLEALQIWRKYRNTWKGQTVEQGKQFLLEIRTKALAQNR